MSLIQAVEDKIVVELLKEENKTKGGLHIPDSAGEQAPQKYGKVLSMGEDVTKEIKIGDTVSFHQRAGMDVLHEGQILKVIKSDEVYGTVI